MIPPEAGTVVDCFLAHPERVHFTFDHGNGHTREYPGPQLAAEAAGLALHFRRLGIVPGDRVAVVVPTSEPLLCTIVAAWFARAAIVVLPHRLGGARSAASADKLQRMIAKVSPRIVVGYADVEATVRTTLDADQHYLAAEALGDIGPAAVDDTMRPRPEDLALLQFTSGSQSGGRAVMVRHFQLQNNSLAVIKRTAATTSDKIFSWLPIYHDLGFLSGVSFPLFIGTNAALMPTEAFISEPESMLDCIRRQGATMTAAPGFTLDLLARTMESKRISGSHLSELRAFYVGAEPLGRSELPSLTVMPAG